METIYEVVKVTTKDGSTATFEIVADPTRFPGCRAYVQGGTQYYDLDTFERGLARADAVERQMIGDIFEYDEVKHRS